MKIKSIKISAYAACLLLFAANPALAADKEENDGQDPTRPLTRFDIRTLYTDGIKIPNQPDANQTVILGRIDKPMPMDNKWVFYWRMDVPFVSNDVPSADNPDRDREFGLGNIFNQFIWISPPGDLPLGIQVWAPGFQVKVDSASQDQFGNGRHTFVPLIAWKWQFEGWSLIPIFKYEKAFGDEPSGQDREVENLQFKPLINVTLSDQWFLSLWDTADWVLEKNDGPNDGDWNIPVDIMIGKKSKSCMGISDKCVYSFQLIEPVVEDGDFEKSDTAAQFRVGYFF
jgi:hypothetical protein